MQSSERVKWATLNPSIFGEYYIKPYVRRWNTRTADFQYAFLEFIMNNRYSVVHVPIEHGKSTWVTLVMPLWETYCNRNLTGALFSNTARQAESFMRRIAWHIENNPMLLQDFGDWRQINYKDIHQVWKFLEKNTHAVVPDYEEKWTDEMIQVMRDPAEQSKDPTWQALGTGGAIYGARLERVYADDIVDIKNSSSAIMRKRVSDWWFEMVESRVIEEGRACALGTLQHPQDLLCEMSDNQMYSYLRMETPDPKTGESLWPQQWTVKRLADKKISIGTIRFKKQFGNDRKVYQGNLLNPNWLHYYGPNEQKQLPALERMVLYAAVDPAITEERQLAQGRDPDYMSWGVMGYFPEDKHVYLIEITRHRGSLNEQLVWLQRQYDKYTLRSLTIRKVSIETNALGRAIKQAAWDLPQMMPINEVHQVKDKTTRFEAMSVHFENGRVLISIDDPGQQIFVGEWCDFPGEHDDTLDVVEMVLQSIGELSPIPYSAKDSEPAQIMEDIEKEMSTGPYDG